MYFCSNFRIQTSMRKRFIHILWGMLVLGILSAVLAFVAIWFGWIGYMPPISELQNPINRFATQVYSADGKVIGTWNENRENRVCIPYSTLSPHLVHALVATEVPSRSSWPSNFIRRRRILQSNVCCKSPSNGLLP